MEEHSTFLMSQHSRLPRATLISNCDQVPEMDAANINLQDHDIECGPSDDASSDDEHFRKLKELFEQNAGLITPGCRDTIDSILSRYGAIRNEVEQDPRIGPVLSATYATTPTQQSFPALVVEQIDQRLDEGPTGLREDRGVRNLGRLQRDAARDLMADYAEYLLHAVSSTSSDTGSSVDKDSAACDDDSNGYITQDTETAGEDSEPTRLNVYADVDTGLFRDQVEPDRHIGKCLVAKPAKETDLVLEGHQDQLLRSNVLTMSPVLQVAAFDPQAAASTGQAVADEPAASSGELSDRARNPVSTSDAVRTYISTPSARTERTEAAPELYGTSGSSGSHEFVEGRLHNGSLMSEDSASSIVVSKEHLKSSRKGTNKVIERPILGYHVDDLLKHIPKRLQNDVRKWFELVRDDEEPRASDEDREKEEAAPSFLAWLERDGAAEHVLNAGMAVAFAMVAHAGQVFF